MNNKKDFICLIVGESGSGKTTLCQALCEKYGLKSIESYTTRPPRFEGETGHTFVTKKEFNELKDKVAYTFFDSHEYCATAEQVEECDLYVIDPAGIDYFLENYHGDKEPVIAYICASEYTRYKRILKRGGGFMYAVNRINHDNQAFKNVQYDFLIDGECSVRRMTRQFNKKIKQHRKKVNKREDV